MFLRIAGVLGFRKTEENYQLAWRKQKVLETVCKQKIKVKKGWGIREFEEVEEDFFSDFLKNIMSTIPS